MPDTYQFPTLDEALARFTPGDSTSLIDARDAIRLAAFVPTDRLAALGCSVKPDVDPTTRVPEPWTPENVLAQVRRDIDFAFETAYNQRGISASLMWDVVKMWVRVLGLPVDPSLLDDRNYAPYGLPLIRAVAAALEYPDPRPDDDGSEW